VQVRDAVEKAAVEIMRRAVTELPRDVKNALRKAYEEEDNPTSKTQLKAILENVELGGKLKAPICQDTGVILFYAAIGNKFGDPSFLPEALRDAVKKATVEIPLRPNAVHPFTRNNTGDNTGVNMPYVNWEITLGDYLDLTVLPKGGGSENMSAFAMLKPGDGIPGVMKFVLETVANAGAQPCPPTIIGVGVGGSADIALKLAKKALLRPIDKPHPDTDIAKAETELLSAVNKLRIGPMGLGGRFTSLGVNIEYAHCHTASLPVGVNVQCWCHRKATARIHKDGKVEHIA